MTATTTDRRSTSLTSYSRFILYGLVLPLLFIAGIQLFVLSGQTDTYFAWTFAAPFSAAFMGAGYWAAMVLPTRGRIREPQAVDPPRGPRQRPAVVAWSAAVLPRGLHRPAGYLLHTGADA